MASVAVSLITAYFGISLEEYPITIYLIFYSVIGMGGSFISLYLSIFFAKRAFGVQVLSPSSANARQRWLLEKVSELSSKAGLPKTPQVGIYNSPEANAFATGPSRSNSLVAVSTGLLEQMDEGEVEGVLAHEVSHIANGDMVTMALVQGMVNTMVLLLARLAATVVASRMSRRSWFLEFALYMGFQIVFNILGSILVVNVFSRVREYRADQGAARLSGKEKIIQALKKLSELYSPSVSQRAGAHYNALKISHQKKSQSFVQTLFSTHPPMHLRIARLERMRLY